MGPPRVSVRGVWGRSPKRSANERERESHANGAGQMGPPRVSVRGVWGRSPQIKYGAGYGDRTRLTGLGSQDITTMLSPLLRRQTGNREIWESGKWESGIDNPSRIADSPISNFPITRLLDYSITRLLDYSIPKVLVICG